MKEKLKGLALGVFASLLTTELPFRYIYLGQILPILPFSHRRLMPISSFLAAQTTKS
jgi:hypothetical protein